MDDLLSVLQIIKDKLIAVHCRLSSISSSDVAQRYCHSMVLDTDKSTSICNFCTVHYSRDPHPLMYASRKNYKINLMQRLDLASQISDISQPKGILLIQAALIHECFISATSQPNPPCHVK